MIQSHFLVGNCENARGTEQTRFEQRRVQEWPFNSQTVSDSFFASGYFYSTNLLSISNHSRLDFVSSEHEYLLHHVLLPRVLPVKYPENQEELERRLLLYIFESVESCSEWIPPATIRFFQTLQRTHDTPNPENISKQINHLQPGEMFAMFIRQQNTALLIHMPKEQSDTNEIKTVNVVTFPGNLHLEEFYNHPSEFMVISILISII